MSATTTEPPCASAEAAQRARQRAQQGVEAEIARLRGFRLDHRLAELAIFTSLWLLGGTLAVACRMLDLPIVGTILGILIAAVGLNAFVLLVHDGMHHTLFLDPTWNRWLSVVLGATFLTSFTAYQVMHLRHHDYLGDPRDPDEYVNYTDRPRLLWAMHFVRLFLGAFLYILLIPRLAWRFAHPEQRRRMLQEYAVMAVLAGLVGWLVPGPVLLYAWFLPALAMGCFVNVRGLTQHGFAEPSDPFLASRTIQPHPLVAFCLLNENYHLEHHLFPEVPSYHLARLHRLIAPNLPRGVVGRSYAGFLARFLWAFWRADPSPIGITLQPHRVSEARR